jgi:hypothetical protein
MDSLSPRYEALVLTGPANLNSGPCPCPGPFEVLCRLEPWPSAERTLRSSRRIPGYGPHLPFIPGHEWAGQVAALGKIRNTSYSRIAWQKPEESACPNYVAGHYNMYSSSRLETGIRRPAPVPWSLAHCCIYP